MFRKILRKRIFLPLLIGVLMVAAGIATLIPLIGSADASNDVQNFFCKAPTSTETFQSESIPLRFAFTVSTSFNGEAGIVYSTTNNDPAIGATGCQTASATVYPANHYLTNGQETLPPGSGRKCATATTASIANASFSTPVYVCAYLTDDGATYYSEVLCTSVCANLGHDNPVSGKILRGPTATDPGEQQYVCARCGDVVMPVDMVAYNAEIAQWQAGIATFSFADFGGSSITTDLEAAANKYYPDTPVYPTVGQHPRVLFNASDIPGIQEALENAPQTVKDAYYVAAYDDRTWGVLGPAQNRDDGFHNFDGGMLNKLQMLALDYQLTGNEISGYLSIYALKNYLKRMDFQRIDGDQCRQFGFVMYTAACVYDWCHDLMSATDKAQIVAAVQHKVCAGSNQSGARMEVGFPPSGQGAISGHGTEFQILRDYLSFAIAIYDEYPGWWDFIGGRFYKDYVPVRNEFYKAEMYPQGESLYVRIRYTSDLYSAWLIKAMSGSIPYDATDMKEIARTIYTYELKKINDRYYALSSGDDQVPYGDFIDYGRVALISSYLFEDETIRAELEHFKYSYSKFNNSFTVVASPGEYLICSSNGVEAADDRHEDLPLIRYNGGWLGQIIARNTWGSEPAIVLMKIGVRTTANHEHYDSGSFQIFYRSRLAVDSGVYDGYGNNHHYYYHQATVAHNSLLIYNPSLSSTDNGYYSGGQKRRGETGNFNNGGENAWLTSDKYKTGEVTGMRYAYADDDETEPLYAYIAGDIAAAYDGSVASEVTRRMLTVYDTDNADVPMFFFVFDNITAKSGSYQKKFLLHVPTEPTVDAVNKTVTVVNGHGKMVLQNVIGNNVSLVPLGGTNRNYVLNTTEDQLNSPHNKNDGFWGRVEIRPATGNATDQLLNVIYVCDNDKNPGLVASAITNDVVRGAAIGNSVAVFVTNATRRSTTFSFTSTGTGNKTYYVSGVEAGDWTVLVNGNTVTSAEAEGGLLVFTAPVGNVTLIPAGLTGYGEGGTLGNNSWDSVGFSSILP